MVLGMDGKCIKLSLNRAEDTSCEHAGTGMGQSQERVRCSMVSADTAEYRARRRGHGHHQPPGPSVFWGCSP